MVKLVQGVRVDDELCLYLVANGLKPASIIEINPMFFDKGYKIKKVERGFEIYEDEDIRIKKEHVDDFLKFLKDNELNFVPISAKMYDTLNEDNQPIKYESMTFNVGKNKPSLAKLVDANEKKEIGLALGYPQEAVDAFTKIIDGERIDGYYILVNLAKAKQAGLEIPTWLAYINFIPERMDIVGGNISPTAKFIGLERQAYVRVNNPDLANRVESCFLNKKLPKSWQKARDSGYDINFF